MSILMLTFSENLSKTVAYCIESKYNIHGRKFDLIIKFIKMEG